MKTKKKIPWFTLLRLFGILLFVYILTTIDFAQAWDVFKSAGLTYVLLALVFQVFLLIIKAFRWDLIRKTKAEKINRFLNAARFFESYAVGVVTPGRLGEFMKAGHEEKKTDKFNSIIKIFYERGFDLGVFVLISGLFFIYFFSSHIPLLGGLLILTGALLLVVTFLLMTNKKVIEFSLKWVQKIKKTDTDISHLNYSFAQSSMIFMLSIGSNIFYYLSGYFLALSVSINESLLNISGIISLTGIINLLPITVMGVGTREASFLYFLSEYPANQVIAFSLLMFLVAQIGGALVSLLLSQIIFITDKKQSNG